MRLCALLCPSWGCPRRRTFLTPFFLRRPTTVCRRPVPLSRASRTQAGLIILSFYRRPLPPPPGVSPVSQGEMAAYARLRVLPGNSRPASVLQAASNSIFFAFASCSFWLTQLHLCSIDQPVRSETRRTDQRSTASLTVALQPCPTGTRGSTLRPTPSPQHLTTPYAVTMVRTRKQREAAPTPDKAKAPEEAPKQKKKSAKGGLASYLNSSTLATVRGRGLRRVRLPQFFEGARSAREPPGRLQRWCPSHTYVARELDAGRGGRAVDVRVAPARLHEERIFIRGLDGDHLEGTEYRAQHAHQGPQD